MAIVPGLLALQAVLGPGARAADIVLANATGVSPDQGPAAGGNTVTITGTGFTGATEVTFGSAESPSFTVVSDTQVTAVVPPEDSPTGSDTVQVFVIPEFGGTSSANYTYLHGSGPGVADATQVSPASGPAGGGNTVTIFGTGFTGAKFVTFGTAESPSFTVVSDSEVTAVVPPKDSPTGSDTVQVFVTPEIAGTSSANYTYIDAPTVTGVAPSSGPAVGGTTVTITGTGFAGATAVRFGSVAATSFIVASATLITATAPAETAGTVDVTVTTPDGTSATSSADQYTYQPAVGACTTTITGTHATPLAVTSGLTCLVNATQNGQVTVAAGAALSVTNSTIAGTMTATSPAGLTYCHVTENGTLSVTGATGPVILGGTLPSGTTCAADTIPGAVTVSGASGPVTVTGLKQNGTLTLTADTGGVTLDGSQVDGLVHVENNAATAPAAITVAGNTVTGSLLCTGNDPAPVDNGRINTVSGTATSQCAAIAQR